MFLFVPPLKNRERNGGYVRPRGRFLEDDDLVDTLTKDRGRYVESLLRSHLPVPTQIEPVEDTKAFGPSRECEECVPRCSTLGYNEGTPIE